MSSAAARSGAAVVVSAGKMMKTVKVRMIKQEWNRHLRKNFAKPVQYLVNDPNSSVVEGDIVTLAPERHSQHVFHTVASIIAPFGKPLDGRPPLLTPEQREHIWETKRKAKLERRAGRGTSSAMAELRERGWDGESSMDANQREAESVMETNNKNNEAKEVEAMISEEVMEEHLRKQ